MKKKYIIFIHILFWFYMLNQALFPVYIGKVEDSYFLNNKYLKDTFITVFLNMISFYAIYLAFPKLLKIRLRIAAISLGLLLIGIIIFVRLPIGWYFWKYIGQAPVKEMVFDWIWVWNEMRLTIIIGIYAILIYYLIGSFESQKLKNELINQRQAGELALLRSQVNPHFLFNTLNNIYALVYKKSDVAPSAIMKLSSIMRYMLYDANAEKVMLDKEIEYLKSFIELQKLRIRQPEFVTFQIEGNTEGFTIAPMLLIPFIENAFRHGSKNHRPGIMIHLTTKGPGLHFEVTNYVRIAHQGDNDPASGIGLANIKRRLELIYPGRHTLTIDQKNDQYKVTLLIEN